MTKASLLLPAALAGAFTLTNLWSAWADERLTNTISGFDTSKAIFSFDSEPTAPPGSALANNFSRLRTRAEKKFQDAGIKFGGIAQQGTPRVLLTLLLTPVKGCEAKSLYYRKLEIQENVLIERVPNGHYYTTTYESGFGYPMLVETPVYEQLEKDLDSLVDGFIEDYKIWNRRPERAK